MLVKEWSLEIVLSQGLSPNCEENSRRKKSVKERRRAQCDSQQQSAYLLCQCFFPATLESQKSKKTLLHISLTKNFHILLKQPALQPLGSTSHVKRRDCRLSSHYKLGTLVTYTIAVIRVFRGLGRAASLRKGRE